MMRERGRAGSTADRHRRAARHRPALRRAGGREAVRHRRPAGRRRAQPRHAREEVPQAQEIVEEEIQRFARWLGQLETLPTVSALREHGDGIVEQVLAENAGRWESASERDLARVEAIARAVMGRLLHEPTIRLRSLCEDAVTRASSSCASCSGCATDADSPQELRSPRAKLAEVHDLQPPSRGLMRIGTRGSALALAQAGLCRRDRRQTPRSSAVPTSGDRGVADGEDKSRWVARARAGTAGRKIDLAVHSAKDVPGELVEGL